MSVNLTQSSSLGQVINADEGCLGPAHCTVTRVERLADARVTAYKAAAIRDTMRNVTFAE